MSGDKGNKPNSDFCPLIDYLVKDMNNGKKLYNRLQSHSKTLYPKNWQEIMSRLFLNLFRGGAENYRGAPENAEPWLYSCIKRENINYIREKIRNGRISCFSEIQSKEDYDNNSFAEQFAQTRFDSPEETAIKKEEAEVVNENISRLNKKHRQVIRLFYWRGFSYKKIGESLKIPTNTVTNILYTTKKKFAKSESLISLVN